MVLSGGGPPPSKVMNIIYKAQGDMCNILWDSDAASVKEEVLKFATAVRCHAQKGKRGAVSLSQFFLTTCVGGAALTMLATRKSPVLARLKINIFFPQSLPARPRSENSD